MRPRARVAILALPLVLGAALPAPAGDVVSPEAFAALAEGRTLHFTLDGRPFGSEQYFAGRRSLWRFADGTCAAGTWYAQADRVCFAYDHDPGPQCWHFRQGGGGFAAALVEDGIETGLVLDLARVDDEPLPCPGPHIGS